MIDLLIKDYKKKGVCVYDNWIQYGRYSRIVSKILLGISYDGVKRNKIVAKDDVGKRRRFKDIVLHADHLIEHAPEIFKIYDEIRELASEITGKRVLISPFGKSAITAKLYKGVGSEHGWHVESNSISGILFLTSNTDGPLEYKYKEEDIEILPKQQSLVIMRGHDVMHRVAPMQTDETRMSVVFNLYFPNDIQRPKNLDEKHYQ